MNVEIINYYQRHINAWIKDEMNNVCWLLTSFYGHPDSNKRNVGWELLNPFKPNENIGWCVIGGLHEIVVQ